MLFFNIINKHNLLSTIKSHIMGTNSIMGLTFTRMSAVSLYEGNISNYNNDHSNHKLNVDKIHCKFKIVNKVNHFRSYLHIYLPDFNTIFHSAPNCCKYFLVLAGFWWHFKSWIIIDKTVKQYGSLIYIQAAG